MDEKTTRTENLQQLMGQLKGAAGREYWKGLEQVADSPDFRKWIDDEFPDRASLAGLDRRQFLKYMGASAALAGVLTLGGCRNLPGEKIVPYVNQPEDLVPGKPLQYATAIARSGYGIGVLAESHMGRPVKLEGNPEHPSSLGALDALTQASILDLYDPQRLQSVLQFKAIRGWDAFNAEITATLAKRARTQGKGIRIVTQATSSPTFQRLMAKFLAKYPEAKWLTYETVNRDNVYAGAAMAFGKAVETNYHFDKAKVILTLDGDFLRDLPGSNRYAREFGAKRDIRGGQREMNRLYTVESAVTLCGAIGDHRLPVRASQVESVARAVASAIGVPGIDGGEAVNPKFVEAVAADLAANKGASVVVVGDHQPAAVHAIAHAINAHLGNAGTTVTYHQAVLAENKQTSSEAIRSLSEDLKRNQVSMLLFFGCNPIFDAPADIQIAEKMANVPFTAHLGMFEDETSDLCQWQLPLAHDLEAWGDVRGHDGTATIQQPLIAPLYEGRAAIEVLSLLCGELRSSADLVRATWEASNPELKNQATWDTTVEKGVVSNSASAAAAVSFNGAIPAAGGKAGGELELLVLPDPTIYDGRFANNGWLQELPKPLTTLTWDNTVQIGIGTAASLGLASHDLVSVTVGDKTVEKAPVWVVPGMADGQVVIHGGYGRTKVGIVGEKAGFNIYPLRNSKSPNLVGAVQLTKTGGGFPLAATQLHHSMEGRNLVQSGTLEEFLKTGHVGEAHEGHEGPDTNLYQPSQFEYDGHKWALSIDLNLCSGCHACVAACQAENNIPVVGKEQVVRGREMHWIRIDRYYRVNNGGEGTDIAEHPEKSVSAGSIETVFQPLTCQQCEQAPCEPVCPVAATVHSKEGLNQMVYNRCVGTRYCSNNCPYKVRRFNYLNFADRDNYPSWGQQPGRHMIDAPTLRLLNNPDVSVRGRGVMEKCTYCTQRINEARIESKKSGKPIEDGEILTACQQACPTGAIVFGDLSDSKSRASQLRNDRRNYVLLEELNTKPRTTYLGKLRNPNPSLEA